MGRRPPISSCATMLYKCPFKSFRLVHIRVNPAGQYRQGAGLFFWVLSLVRQPCAHASRSRWSSASAKAASTHADLRSSGRGRDPRDSRYQPRGAPRLLRESWELPELGGSLPIKKALELALEELKSTGGQVNAGWSYLSYFSST